MAVNKRAAMRREKHVQEKILKKYKDDCAQNIDLPGFHKKCSNKI